MPPCSQGDTAACAPGLCSHLCLLSPVHPRGYKCACPEGLFLLPSGKCAELSIVYAEEKAISLVQVGPGARSRLVQKWLEPLHLQDVDWQRSVLYGTDDGGTLLRVVGHPGRREAISTGLPICSARVDIRSGDLYWLACNRKDIGVSRAPGMAPRILHRARSGIQHLFLDWQRGALYWLARGQPLQQLSLAGGTPQDAWNETWPEELPAAMDSKAFTLLWSSASGLRALSLTKRQAVTLSPSWPHGLVAAFEPYLVSMNGTALLLWDRRTLTLVLAVPAVDVQGVVTFVGTELQAAPVPLPAPTKKESALPLPPLVATSTMTTTTTTTTTTTVRPTTSTTRPTPSKTTTVPIAVHVPTSKATVTPTTTARPTLSKTTSYDDDDNHNHNHYYCSAHHLHHKAYAKQDYHRANRCSRANQLRTSFHLRVPAGQPAPCQSHEYPCGLGTCLNASLVCDGRQDCADGSDEGGNCSVPCRLPCSHLCHPSPQGPRCRCAPGYRLAEDGVSCTDVDECKERGEGACSQTCLNAPGNYSCGCLPGYLLEPDGRICKLTGPEPTLLVAVQSEVLSYGLRSGREKVLLATDKERVIFSLDYDPVERKVFWVDLGTESIRWQGLDSGKKGTLVKGVRSDCIAVDWVGRNLYWTDGVAGQVLATHLGAAWRGVPEYTVVLDGDLDRPHSLVLQPLAG
nr:PREDICTED: low-density lipoprotein receptor-related protein 4-like [Apteryx mantelli mantelli]